MDNITDAQYSEAFEGLAKHQKEISDHNDKVMESSGVEVEDMECLLECVVVTGKITIVKDSEVRGDRQGDDDRDTIKNIHVDQWSVSDALN